MFIKQLKHDLNFSKNTFLIMIALTVVACAIIFIAPVAIYYTGTLFIFLALISILLLILIGIISIVQVARLFNRTFYEHANTEPLSSVPLQKSLLSKNITAMIWFNCMIAPPIIIWLLYWVFYLGMSTFLNTFYFFLGINNLAFFFINVVFLCITLFHVFPIGRLRTISLIGLIGWVWLYFHAIRMTEWLWVWFYFVNSAGFIISLAFGAATFLITSYLLTKHPN